MILKHLTALIVQQNLLRQEENIIVGDVVSLIFSLTPNPTDSFILGNVFCSKCSDQKSVIPSSNKSEKVRVCITCFNEINQEIAYLNETLPILQRGETFKTKSLLGLSTKFISLRLMADGKNLIYEENNNSEPITIPLSTIDNIIPSSFVSFDIMTSSANGTKTITYSFEAANKSLQQLWIISLKQLVDYYVKQLNFTKNNELLRQRKKLEMKSQLEQEESELTTMGEIDINISPEKTAREQRKLQRDQIREKYGLNK